jgi:ABC-2 type transport system permease protein
MFLKIFTFELRYWLRQPMVYIFLLINVLMFGWAAASSELTIGGSAGNVFKNAPSVIQSQYGIWCTLALLMTTAFVQNAALRDFMYKTNQIVFSSPVQKLSYLAGRFLGAYVVALIPFLGISLGIILGTWIGQATGATDADRYGPIVWSAHWNGFSTFAMTNTFVAGAFIFMLAVLSRSTVIAFVGSVVLLVAQITASTLLGDVEQQGAAIYFDALGFAPLGLITKYWTVVEQNTQSVSFLEPQMLLNRLLWIGVAGLLLAFAYVRFSFADRAPLRLFRVGRATQKSAVSRPVTDQSGFGPTVALPAVRLQTGVWVQLSQLWRIARTDFGGVVTGNAFIVILLLGLINMGFSLQYAGQNRGETTLPVTYYVIDSIRGSMFLFLIAILVFYSGELIWKERDANVAQINDALPHPTWVMFAAKLLAMIGVIVVVLLTCIGAGMVAQALQGYTGFDPGQYLMEFLVLDLSSFIPLIILSMLVHTLVNNKYLAFFVFIAVLILNSFIWRPLDVGSRLVRFNATPGYVYSDMNGFGPFMKSYAWFQGYWLLFAGLLGMGAVFFWLRGQDTRWPDRLRQARVRFGGGPRVLTLGLLAAFVTVGGFIFYNTHVLNPYLSAKAQERGQVAYETNYKRFQHRPQPRVTDARYAIDFYPAERDLIANGNLMLTNKSAGPIDSIHIVLPARELTYALTLDPARPRRARLLLNDEAVNYRIYRLSPALAPGDSLRLTFTAKRSSRGIENSVVWVKQINENGSFLNNFDFVPQLGYQEQGELEDKNDRKKYGLTERARLPKRDPTGTGPACNQHYISNNSDWLRLETVLSTSPDQIAIAPGSLLKEWRANDAQGRPRRYFRYRLEQPSINFYTFISARYEVARERWNGIDVEVYYDKKHPTNVPNMVRSIKESLAYYTANFGPYRHKQARIVEFPRYEAFAQAFPGTMPYSEGIGFISKIDPDKDIDMVKYVVAHEMAHQWWAHQVIGAEMQGETMLSETQAQYSALMVMEKTYGRNRMKRFLTYEIDNYLNARGSESQKEVPLELVENQGYIHYRKGSAVMFALKEMIGERSVNKALRALADRYAYRPAPYPTSRALVDLFRQNTPDSLQYVIRDLFETITIYDNRTTEATSKKRPDGRYDVTVAVQSQKFRADSLGRETPVSLNDWVDLGVYGKPAPGKKQGDLLAIRRERIHQKTGKYTFTVSGEPYEAGIDPLSYLIDRIPADNLKRVN